MTIARKVAFGFGALLALVATPAIVGLFHSSDLNTTRTTLLVAMIAMTFGGALAIWTTRGMTKSIHRLTEALSAVAKGDHQRIEVRSNDELGNLTRSYNQMVDDTNMELVPVCREGESMAVAAGLWVGGKKPVVLIQNTGMFESGDSIRGLGLDIDFPMVMMIGYRGWTRHGVTPDSAARFTEKILDAWDIDFYLVETDDDVDRISTAFELSERKQRPVACLMGAEYA